MYVYAGESYSDHEGNRTREVETSEVIPIFQSFGLQECGNSNMHFCGMYESEEIDKTECYCISTGEEYGDLNIPMITNILLCLIIQVYVLRFILM